jgi:uncharacterized protein YukE
MSEPANRTYDYNYFTHYRDDVCQCPLCTKDRHIESLENQLATCKKELAETKELLQQAFETGQRVTEERDIYKKRVSRLKDLVYGIGDKWRTKEHGHLCQYRVNYEAIQNIVDQAINDDNKLAKLLEELEGK